MLLEIKELKTLIQENIGVIVDHALFHPSDLKIFWMESEPTVEKLVEWIAETLAPLLPEKVALRKLKLY